MRVLTLLYKYLQKVLPGPYDNSYHYDSCYRDSKLSLEPSLRGNSIVDYDRIF